MRIRILILVFMLTATGCARYTMDEVLLQRSEISLTWKGELQVEYEAEKFQIGFNEHRNEFRVYDDKLANWFIVRLSSFPSYEGEELSATVSWTGKKSTKTFSDLDFKVEQSDEKGHHWLWNESNKIGIIIKNIK
jgi:hypothetical protein